MKIIAVEEHYTTQRYMDYIQSRPQTQASPEGRISFGDRMSALTSLEERLRIMDEAGIDMQVLQLTRPGVETLDPAEGTEQSRLGNDELADIIRNNPERLAGFACIAPQEPEAAADELERAVTELGLVGFAIHSNIHGEYLDEPKYEVLLARAAKLKAPIYIHPKQPSNSMIAPYAKYPILTRAMWGFAADAGLHGMCLICSGIFDKYPDLQIILGHMGESLPYWLWRLDAQWRHEKLAHNVKLEKENFSQYIKDNFYITTSGMFWTPALQLAQAGLGTDRILFAVDYPYENSKDGVNFLKVTPISDIDREKIAHGNSERLFRL